MAHGGGRPNIALDAQTNQNFIILGPPPFPRHSLRRISSIYITQRSTRIYYNLTILFSIFYFFFIDSFLFLSSFLMVECSTPKTNPEGAGYGAWGWSSKYSAGRAN
jgi:hypothetical protein